MAGQFWQDLSEDLNDLEFARSYAGESIRIATNDSLVNDLDELREAAGLTKARLARAIGSDPSVVRRLLSSESVNPTIATVPEVAAALGMKLILSPMSSEERQQITEPMLAAVGR
ncbi:helix-turn-helix transcriptional regulator [Brevibacterium ravenspurgense]|uniref:helix-turn-helix domain-containing protein n=1 Tax=Brevibacterium ravenspurgense TaxID=479117 RepID=UPI001EF20328|nr:helix-turn-helix transcriptional regulator [Brevibacterium ravenspurgense]MCG7300551.1 helix-turn-helix transcriptional regulator [Brevibacterium ravenspurgense]